ncbi:hypothetical protein [Chitinolyticbacter albus]|uniref:hypothetical protein n=1 Tax=Chitinolyticbacter albus TaxID=2961951 RepID=UPI00210E890C|nr:hypothetical protein [Chitinolyticbacter albus]
MRAGLSNTTTPTKRNTTVVDAAFPGRRWRTLWIASLGYGLVANLPPRLPRLTEDEAVVFR